MLEIKRSIMPITPYNHVYLPERIIKLQLMIYLRKVKLKDHNLISGDPERLKFPYCTASVRYMDMLEFRKPVTFLVGENGIGKSTLLEAMMYLYDKPDKKAPGMLYDQEANKTYANNLHENIILEEDLSPADHFSFRAEAFFNHAALLDARSDYEEFLYGKSYILQQYGGRKLLEQSHGESFLNTFLNYSGRGTLFILDEPEAALSPQRQLTLLVRINELVKQNSQLIISTHSPILMAYPDADIYTIQEDGITLTPYEETEHYQLTKYFLNHTEQMLRELIR